MTLQSIEIKMIQNPQVPSTLPINRKLLNSNLIREKIGNELYERLSLQLLQFRLSTFPLYFITQICDELQVNRNAKFLSRYVLDLVLDCSQTIFNSEFGNLTIASLAYTLQIFPSQDTISQNEGSSLISEWISQFNIQSLLEDIKELMKEYQQETDILMTCSPYDYVGSAISLASLGVAGQALVKKGLNAVIDLALSHPELSQFSSEDIFSGSYQALVQIKISSLSDKTLPVIVGLGSGEKSQEIKAFILKEFSS